MRVKWGPSHIKLANWLDINIIVVFVLLYIAGERDIMIVGDFNLNPQKEGMLSIWYIKQFIHYLIAYCFDYIIIISYKCTNMFLW